MVAMLLGEGCYNICRRVDRTMFLFFLGSRKNIPLLPAINFHWLPYVISSKHSIVHRDG